MPDFVLPGETVHQLPPEGKTPISTGLRIHNDKIIAEQPGKFLMKGNSCVLISSPSKYIPSAHDFVIGVIVDRLSENFKVDIDATEYAMLPFTEFESYTKKNRPDIPVNALIYCRVTSIVGPDVETELSCLSTEGKADGFGHLTGGYLVNVPISFCRKVLRSKEGPVSKLGKSLSFELAVGLNGKIWINSPSCQVTLFVANILKKVGEVTSTKQQEVIVDEALKQFSSS
ncbi:hypothetical protein P9112_004361 [Eukaryota sp. TZLM1-RC]